MPLPTMAAISLGDSTTESGPAGVLRRSNLLWLEDSALGVGAPTAVSATGGGFVGGGPQPRPALFPGGAPDPPPTSPPPPTAAGQPRPRSPLKPPLPLPPGLQRPS